MLVPSRYVQGMFTFCSLRCGAVYETCPSSGNEGLVLNKGKSAANSERKRLLPERDGCCLINNTFHFTRGLEALCKGIRIL